MSMSRFEHETPQKISTQSYDAIIFGAGIAGLTAAAYLVLGGARVLVCEQAPKVGGLFNSFERDGFWFDGGIKAIENSGLFLSTLKQLGMQERIKVHKSPIGMITNGKMQLFNAWQDVENYYADLQVLFPDDQKGLLQVEADSKAIFDLLDSLLTFPIPIMDTPSDNKSARSDWFKEKKRKPGAVSKGVGDDEDRNADVFGKTHSQSQPGQPALRPLSRWHYRLFWAGIFSNVPGLLLSRRRDAIHPQPACGRYRREGRRNQAEHTR